MPAPDGAVVVTGASGALGRAVVRDLLHRSDCRIVAVGRSLARLRAAYAEPTARVTLHEADPSRAADLEALRDRLDGDLDVSGLVCTAGGTVRREPLTAAAWTSVEADLDGNLMTALVPNKVFGATMAARGHGAIVNVASTYVDRPNTGYAAYVTAKAAVVALTRELAAELGPAGVRVNCVNAGYFWSALNEAELRAEPETRARIERRIPLRRLGNADEVAHAIAWLLTADASYVTGAVLRVDGGYGA